MKLSIFSQKSIILGLTLLAFVLRAYRLDAQSYWIDEAWTIFYAHLSLSELWVNLQTIRAAPPLYHVLTIYWVKLVGDGEYALRFFSLLSSMLAIPLSYRLGKSLEGYRLGLIAALLLAISPYQIWHAQDARNYSMLTAASIMSMWGFVNLWRWGGWRWWLIYVAGTEWAVMTHYHGLVLIGIQGLFLLFTGRRNWRNYLAWAGTLIVILLPLTAWLFFGSTLWQRQHWLPQVGLWASYERGAIAYSVGELVPHPTAVPLTLVFVIVYLTGLVYATRRSWKPWHGSQMLIFLLAYTLAPNLAIWLYSQYATPTYLERYLISVQIGYFLSIALGILAVLDAPQSLITKQGGGETGELGRIGSKKESPLPLRPPAPLLSFSRWFRPLVTLALLLLLVGISSWVLNHHYSDPVYAKPNWRGVIETIENNTLPGDAILMTGDGGEKLFDFYYQGNLPVYYDFNTPVPPAGQARQRLAEIAASHQRLWYTPYGVDIDATLEQWLVENTYPAWQSWLGRKRLALYDSQPPRDRLETLEVTFADESSQGLVLTNIALPSQPIPAGDLLPLALTWQTLSSLAHDYQLSIRLTNNRGDIFAQSDWPPLASVGGTSTWPLNQPITDQRSLWLPPDTPPGTYTLQLVVYEPSSGQLLGQPVTLSGVTVAPAQIIPPLEALTIPNPIQNPAVGLQAESPELPSGHEAGKTQNNGVTLVGYAAPEKIQPGQDMWLWLYWQAQHSPLVDTLIRLTLSSENESSSADFLLFDSVGSLDSWQPGQVRRAIYHLPTSPRLSGQQATLTVVLANTAGHVEAETNLTSISLESRARQFDLPSSDYPTEVAFGNATQLKLIGYDLAALSFTPGDRLPLTLYWQAEAEMAIDYTAFVQLLNSAGQVVAQVDLQPQAGAAPTTTWLPGEIVADSYTLPLPADLPSGPYRLITGLYDAETGARLPLGTGSDYVELQQIKLVK